MRINLNQSEITTAIIHYLQSTGVNISGDVAVDYTAKRNPSMVTAELTFNEELDSKTPVESVSEPENVFEEKDDSDELPFLEDDE